MKENKEILKSVFEPKGFTIQRALGLREDHDLIADPGYKRILFAMKEAQVEAIKELVKRKWDNSVYFWQTNDPNRKSKTIDDLALELIKEIES